MWSSREHPTEVPLSNHLINEVKEMYKKVLKLTAQSTVIEQNGEEKQCVKIAFQNYKDCYQDDGSDIIIYRREEPGYIFDYDEKEYFDCLPLPTPKEVIFRGHLKDMHTFCEYYDTTAAVGKVYAYWVGKGEVGESLTGPVAVKMRDRSVWWHFDEVLERTYKLKEKFPNIDLLQVGETRLGKPLVAILVGNRKNMIAAVGAVHAGESGPEILITFLEEVLTETPDAFDKCGIAVFPSVSADNREEMVNGAPWYIRKSAGGVDLIRNFDADWDRVDFSYGLSSDDPKSPTYRGPCPNSEPEVKALIKLMETVNPRAVFSYHFLCSISTDRLLSYGGASNDPDYITALDKTSIEYSKAFREAIGAPERKFRTTELICSAGSLIAWLYKRGIVAFDLEMSGDLEETFPSKKDKSTKEALDLAIKGHEAALLKMIKVFE